MQYTGRPPLTKFTPESFDMPTSSALPDPATALPGEASLLDAVVADLRDNALKLVYADWLEERGDARAAFLREYVGALETGDDLPRGRGISAGWQEMLGVPLIKRIDALQLTPNRANILALAKPALAIRSKRCPEKDFLLGATRLGGRPSLPKGTEWPRCKGGPLEFLAQFDLAELQQTVAGRALPSTGLISFFMYHSYEDDEHGGPGGLQIIHTPKSPKLALLDPPDDLTPEFGRPNKVCRVLFTEVLDVPDHDDTWLDAYGFDFDTSNGDFKSPALGDANHQLFGYAEVTVLTQDPTPGKEWQLLARFNSDDRMYWGWGDGHRLFWYIKSANLHRARFDKTVAVDG
jgi:uncharacterized protein (TIGR02996 family)